MNPLLNPLHPLDKGVLLGKYEVPAAVEKEAVPVLHLPTLKFIRHTYDTTIACAPYSTQRLSLSCGMLPSVAEAIRNADKAEHKRWLDALQGEWFVLGTELRTVLNNPDFTQINVETIDPLISGAVRHGSYPVIDKRLAFADLIKISTGWKPDLYEVFGVDDLSCSSSIPDIKLYNIIVKPQDDTLFIDLTEVPAKYRTLYLMVDS